MKANAAAVVTALWLLAAPAAAPQKASTPTPRGDHGVSLVVAPSGCYELSIDATGVPKLTPLDHHYDQVIVLGWPTPTPPGPTPDPTPPPTPGPLTERAKLFRDAAFNCTADTKRPETAQGLAMVYREIAKQIDAGTATDKTAVWNATSTMHDLVTAKQGALAAWVPFKETLAKQWAVVGAGGGQLKDYAALLKDAANGLDASAPQKAISPEFWAFLLQLIQLILTLLKPT